MAKITRKTQKIFADSAAASQLTAFGSIKENSPNPPVYTKDPDTIQTNEYLNGWSGATQDDYAPYRQDMNALQYLFSRQIAYLMQAGIPEYDSATQYYANCSFCQINGVVYLCIQDALNKLPTTEPTYWTEIDFSKFAPKDSPAFTGTPTAPTPASSDDSTKIATTAFIKAVLGGYAPLSSPVLTGTPTAPTASTGNSSTQIATTAFVQASINQASINMPLFHHFWSDYEVNDTNFLRADNFSWQDGTAYNGPYDHLVDDIDGKSLQSETVEGITIQFYEADDGHKIAPASEEANVLALYTMSGVAWYYILDTVNQRFKLPRTQYGFVGVRDSVGKYVPETLPNIKSEWQTNNRYGSDRPSIFMNPTGAIKNKTYYGTGGVSIDVSGSYYGYYDMEFNASYSSSTYQDDAPVQQRATQMYLYFYVGNFTQTAIENTAGLNASLFNNKVDLDLNNVSTTSGFRRLVEVYNNGADYYKVFEEYDPSDGSYIGKWCEQGGKTSSRGSDSWQTINLLKPFLNTDYTVLQTNITGYTQNESGVISDITTSSFKIFSWAGRASFWEAKGYIS